MKTQISPLKFWLGLALVTVGLVRPAMFLLRIDQSNPNFFRAISLLSLSPLPRVFDRPGYFLIPRAIAQMPSGESITLLSKQTRAVSPGGTWHRKSAMIHSMMDGPIYGQAAQDSFLKFYFCERDLRGRKLAPEEIPLSVDFEMSQSDSDKSPYIKKVIRCAR